MKPDFYIYFFPSCPFQTGPQRWTPPHGTGQITSCIKTFLTQGHSWIQIWFYVDNAYSWYVDLVVTVAWQCYESAHAHIHFRKQKRSFTPIVILLKSAFFMRRDSPLPFFARNSQHCQWQSCIRSWDQAPASRRLAEPRGSRITAVTPFLQISSTPDLGYCFKGKRKL